MKKTRGAGFPLTVGEDGQTANRKPFQVAGAGTIVRGWPRCRVRERFVRPSQDGIGGHAVRVKREHARKSRKWNIARFEL